MSEKTELTRPEIAAIAGRATFKLTDEILEKIVTYVQLGNYAKVAAAACGVTENCYYRWLQRGGVVAEQLIKELGEDVDLQTFADSYDTTVTVLPEVHHNDWMCFKLGVAIAKATAEAEAYAVGIIRKHMPDQWTAAMTYLERKAPDRWKRRELHEVAAAQAQEELSDEERALLEPAAQEHLGRALKAAAELSPPQEG